MRHATQHARVLKPVDVLQNVAGPPHHSGILKPRKLRVVLSYEEGVERFERAYERGVYGEIVSGRVAGPTGSGVASKLFIEEKLLSILNADIERISFDLLRIGSRQ